MAPSLSIDCLATRPVPLRKRSDFIAARGGSRANGTYCRVQVVGNGTRVARIGLTVTKKNGNAVQRNRIKRRLRGVLRTFSHTVDANGLVAGLDYVVIARPGALTAPFAALKDDVSAAIWKARKRLATHDTTRSDMKRDW